MAEVHELHTSEIMLNELYNTPQLKIKNSLGKVKIRTNKQNI